MKTRNGFVSNSSSTSFVVAFKKRYKEVDECSLCGNRCVDVSDFTRYLDKGGIDWSEETKMDADDTKDTIKHVKEYCSEKYSKPLLEKIDEYNNEEWDVMAFRISYHDAIAPILFEGLVKNGRAVVLDKQE